MYQQLPQLDVETSRASKSIDEYDHRYDDDDDDKRVKKGAKFCWMTSCVFLSLLLLLLGIIAYNLVYLQ